MRRNIALAAVALAMATAGPAHGQDSDGGITLALADEGVLMCYRPNVRRKTCESTGFFERMGEGVYTSYDTLALGVGITLDMESPMWLQNGALCGPMREQDVMTGTLRMNGQAVAPGLARPVLYQVVQRLNSMIGQEICAWFEPAGDDYVIKASIDGEYQPEFDRPMKIIGASDGYRVTP